MGGQPRCFVSRHTVAVGAGAVRRFARGYPGIRRATSQIPDRTRTAYREISLALLQPEYPSDWRGARIVISGRGFAGTAPRRVVAQGGTSDSDRTTAEAHPQRRSLLRAGVLLPSLHPGFLYASACDYPCRQGKRGKRGKRRRVVAGRG